MFCRYIQTMARFVLYGPPNCWGQYAPSQIAKQHTQCEVSEEELVDMPTPANGQVEQLADAPADAHTPTNGQAEQRNALEEAREVIAKQMHQNNALMALLEGARNTIAQQAEQHEALADEIADAQTATTELAEQRDALVTQLEDLREVAIKQTHQHSALEAEVKEAHKATANQIEKCKTLKTKLKAARAEAADMDLKRIYLEIDLEHEQTHVREMLESQIEQAEKEAEYWQHERMVLSFEVVDIRDKTLKEARMSINQEIQENKAMVAQLGRARETAIKQTQQLSALEAELKEAHEATAMQTQKYQDLEHELADIRSGANKHLGTIVSKWHAENEHSEQQWEDRWEAMQLLSPLPSPSITCDNVFAPEENDDSDATEMTA